MASVIEICNRALSNIGNNRSINSLNEASKEAGQCSLYYESIRDAVADFDWNFATKTVALADTNNPPLDWDYAYTYPTDCLKIIEIPVRYPVPNCSDARAVYRRRRQRRHRSPDLHRPAAGVAAICGAHH